mmetsp:Transcript_7420/g.27244  ORF Transcript_7420/g.27244 Transcript_7420/m.27244 type:complete len:273 (-) Transcript_7420:160-978(-)
MLQSDSAPGLPTRRTSVNSTPPNSDGERESDQAHAGYANTGITTDENRDVIEQVMGIGEEQVDVNKMFGDRVAQVRYVPDPVKHVVQMYPRLVLRALQSVLALITVILSASSVGDHFVFTLLHVICNIIFAGAFSIALCDLKRVLQARGVLPLVEPTHATEPLDKAKRFLILGINKAAALIDQAETYLSTKIARPQLIQVASDAIIVMMLSGVWWACMALVFDSGCSRFVLDAPRGTQMTVALAFAGLLWLAFIPSLLIFAVPPLSNAVKQL